VGQLPTAGNIAAPGKGCCHWLRPTRQRFAHAGGNHQPGGGIFGARGGGIFGCQTEGNAKFSKNGLRLSPTLLANYGFNQGDEFKVSCLEEGKIVLEKK